MQPHDWLHILEHQDWQADNDEIERLEVKMEKEELKKLDRALEQLTDEEKQLRKEIADLGERGKDPTHLVEELSKKQRERAHKENQYKRILESKNAKLN